MTHRHRATVALLALLLASPCAADGVPSPAAVSPPAPGIAWKAGDALMALGQDGRWYYAQVVTSRDGLFQVDIVGLAVEWVDASRLRPRTADEIRELAGAPPAPRPRRGDARVRAALEELGLPAEADDDGDFRLELPVGDGRTQLAWIDSATSGPADAVTREVWSPAFFTKGRLDAAVARRLLSDERSRGGAWRLVGEGEREAAVFVVTLRADASAAALAETLKLVGAVADAMERDIEGTDAL